MRLFVYFVRMGRELHPKMTWHARIHGKRPKGRLQPSHDSPRHAPYLFHIPARRLQVGHCLRQPVSVLGPPPTTLSHSFLLAQDIFEPNHLQYKHSNILKPSHSSNLPAYEDGTHRVFRNVGI